MTILNENHFPGKGDTFKNGNLRFIISLGQKIILTVLILFYVGSELKSQITVTNSTFPALGDTLRFIIDNLPSVSAQSLLTPPGGNQVWDAGQLQADAQKVLPHRPALEGSFANLIPLADFLVKEDANTEAYYKVFSNRVELLGMRVIVPGSPNLQGNITFQPARIVRRAPMNFFDISQNSSSFLVGYAKSEIPQSFLNSIPFNPDSIRIRESFNELEVVDAWGTITIPNGNFPVLRAKRTTYEEIRMDAKIAPLGWLDVTDLAVQAGVTGLGIDTTIQHYFFSNNSKEPIAAFLLDNNQSAILQITYKNIPGSLPVSLISFSGVNKANKNILQWKTATEINSSKFDIERSTDGNNFQRVGTIASSNAPNGDSYRFDDDIIHYPATKLYYRLKMIDKDGSFKFSNVINIHVEARQEKILLAGNIVDHFIQMVSPSSLLVKPIQADIVNPQGMVMVSKTISGTTSTLLVSQLSPGQYYIRFSQEGKWLQTEKFVKR